MCSAAAAMPAALLLLFSHGYLVCEAHAASTPPPTTVTTSTSRVEGRALSQGDDCVDTAGSPYYDADGTRCTDYPLEGTWCGKYDDSDFTSNTMCCNCQTVRLLPTRPTFSPTAGGTAGSTAGGTAGPLCVDTAGNATHALLVLHVLHGCDYFNVYPDYCGRFDDSDFSSNTMCSDCKTECRQEVTCEATPGCMLIAWIIIVVPICCCCGAAYYCCCRKTGDGKKTDSGAAHFKLFPPKTKPLLMDEEDPATNDIELDVKVAKCPPHWHNQDIYSDFDERYDTSSKIFKTVQDMIDATWKDKFTRDRTGAKPTGFKVVSVHRVEDANMWASYQEVKDSIKKERGTCKSVNALDGQEESGHVVTDPFSKVLAGGESLDKSVNEHYFFHGTSPEGAEGISESGFQINRAGKNGCMFGAGAYFAERSTKSDEYAEEGHGAYRFIYALLVCRVCCGELYRVTKSRRAEIDEAIRTGKYDGVLGDREASVGTYREFVVFRERQIYPEYVVLYKRLHDDDESESS